MRPRHNAQLRRVVGTPEIIGLSLSASTNLDRFGATELAVCDDVSASPDGCGALVSANLFGAIG
ncbi:MAG: hypothetical protein ABSD98_16840 [Candidatus Korobacteraceae bacterium]|jgi:hypothetical protein